MAYRVLGVRLGEPYRAWVKADFAHPGWIWRYRTTQSVFGLLALGTVVGTIWLRTGAIPIIFFACFIGWFAGTFLFPSRTRERAASRQLLPGSNPTWFSKLSNGPWLSLQLAGLIVIVVVIASAPVAEEADPLPAALCSTPPPEVADAVMARVGSPDTSLRMVQLEAPAAAVLVRVGPPGRSYFVVRRATPDAFDVQPVVAGSAGIYTEALDRIDRCR